MTPKQAEEILNATFARLTSRQRANIRWHLEHNTPVLCGTKASWYTDGKGAG